MNNPCPPRSVNRQDIAHVVVQALEVGLEQVIASFEEQRNDRQLLLAENSLGLAEQLESPDVVRLASRRRGF